MLKIDMPKPTNCGDCFLCRAGKCEKAYEAYLKMGSMFFKAVCEPDFMLDDCPIEEIDEAQLPKEGEWIWDSDTGTYLCSECNATSPREDQDGEYIDCPRYCPSCGSRMRKGEQ